jgi:hypothetical protein
MGSEWRAVGCQCQGQGCPNAIAHENADGPCTTLADGLDDTRDNVLPDNDMLDVQNGAGRSLIDPA